MAQIEILMATYNGERFIRQQVESFFAQTNQDWTLTIRDDNSTDSTPKIIEELAAKHPGKIRILRDHDDGRPNDNVRTSQNFGRLLANSTAPYVMFSDQDDVWRPEKIDLTLQKMKEMEAQNGASTPLLVHTDTALADTSNNVLAPSTNQHHKRHKENTSLGRLLVEEPVTGMTMMMNRALAQKASPVPPEASMHDSWVSKVAAATGKIGYIDKPTVNHRVHGNNVSGAHVETRTATQRVSDRLEGRSFKTVIGEKKYYFKIRTQSTGQIASVMLERYGDDMLPQDRKLVEDAAKLPGKSRVGQSVTMVRHGIMPHNSRNRLETLIFAGAQRHNLPDGEETGFTR